MEYYKWVEKLADSAIGRYGEREDADGAERRPSSSGKWEKGSFSARFIGGCGWRTRQRCLQGRAWCTRKPFPCSARAGGGLICRATVCARVTLLGVPATSPLTRPTPNSAEIINAVSQKYNVPRPYVSMGVAVFLFLFVFVGLGASLFSQVIGFAYPAYASFKAIESPGTDDDTQWLTFWVVFAVFSMLENFADTLLWWFPLYYTFKVIFLLWCQSPLTRGAEFLYKNVLRGWFLT
jgi:receptor expression-enhancing protein 5/6